MVANVTTVSLGSRNTEARYTLTQGVTGGCPIPADTCNMLIVYRSPDNSSKTGYAPGVMKVALYFEEVALSRARVEGRGK